VGYISLTHPTRSACCYAVPSASHLNPQLQSMCMVRSPKSITGSVRATLGNAPYGCMVRSPKSITGSVRATLGNAPYSDGCSTQPTRRCALLV